MTVELPPGFTLTRPVGGKTVDMTIAWRKNGPTRHRLCVAVAKYVLRDHGLPPEKPVYALAGINWTDMTVALVLTPRKELESVKGIRYNHEQMIRFYLRVPEITLEDTLDSKEVRYRSTVKDGICTIIAKLPKWVEPFRPSMVIDMDEARARGVLAAAEARRRMKA
jgi:hypothetical protein